MLKLHTFAHDLSRLREYQSKVVGPLLTGFLSLAALVVTAWGVHEYMARGDHDLLEKQALSSEKMLILSELMSIAKTRTQLTGQMLVTEDFFERDDIARELDSFATRFYVLRSNLIEMPMSDSEQSLLEKRAKIIASILPAQREAADLAMSDNPVDLDQARKILYGSVMPGQATLIELFSETIRLLEEDIVASSRKMIEASKVGNIVNLAAIVIIIIGAMLVAAVTIQRVYDVEKQLNNANKELEALNNVKSEFVSLVSHELRTPLTSIRSFAEILIDDIDNIDSDSQRRYLNIINNESNRLSRLVSDILDLQKIDANKMEWHDSKIDLNVIARESFEAFSGALQTKGLTQTIELHDSSLQALIDPDKIRQVILNLLSNALKYTDQGGISIKVTSRATDAEHQLARIEVSDTGIGIPDEHRDSIFESFHQVDNSGTRANGGSGLGLNICQKIIHHYDGKIWVENNASKGSTFFVEIPMAA